MLIAHFIPYLGRAQGGPVLSLATMAAQQSNSGHDVKVFAAKLPSDGEPATFDPRVQLLCENGSQRGGLRWCPALWQVARNHRFDVIHSHSLWTDVNRLAASLARRRRVPHLIAPCGALSPGAMQRRRWKKWPVRWWFVNRALRQATCLHAKSEVEYADCRRAGLRNPVAVIPNPVAGPPDETITAPENLAKRYGLPEDKQCVLYVGRLHPVKGLARLIEAWSQVREIGERRSEIGEWVLVLAGPDEDGYRSELEERARSLGCRDSVVFVGPLSDVEKWWFYRRAAFFVMPSDFENFGLAIGEALLMGVPVITTIGTPWSQLPAAQAGWWVPAKAEAIAGALNEAMSLSKSEHRKMRESAGRLAAQFSMESVNQSLLDTYRWMLGEGSKPECVRLD